MWFVESTQETIAALDSTPKCAQTSNEGDFELPASSGTNAKFGWVEPMYLYTEELGVETDL